MDFSVLVDVDMSDMVECWKGEAFKFGGSLYIAMAGVWLDG